MAETGKTVPSRDNSDFSSISTVPNELKKRSNLLKRHADRLKSRHSRSPKRRAGTPEPEQKGFNDDSEKDTSDGESLNKSEKVAEVNKESRSKNNGIRRFLPKKDNRDGEERNKALEITWMQEAESENDFEVLRQIHKTKELEEEEREIEKIIEDSRRKVNEDIKKCVDPKDMPPLIVAPKTASTRRRHQSLPSEDYFIERESFESFLCDDQRPRMVKRKSLSPREGISMRENIGKEAYEPRYRENLFKSDLEELMVSSSLKDKTREKEKLKCMCEPEPNLSKNEEEQTKTKKRFFFSMFSFESKKQNNEKFQNEEDQVKVVEDIEALSPEAKQWLITNAFKIWKAHVNEHRDYVNRCGKLKNRCITDLILLLFLCGFGGMIFRFTEGAFESFYKCGVKRVKRDFIDALWKCSQYMLEEDWKSQARRRLMEFENQLHSAHEAGMTTYSGQKSWSFLNAVIYCLTVVTTIGYGHISPSTTTGRAITIIYAIFGIPMFLILLADFGKLFTRGIKFLWAFVRRLYYTGSCRKMRKTAPVQEMMKGVQIMYDFAKTRRFSNAGLEKQDHLKPPENINLQGIPETPGTPNWSTFEIDDEFNLPISVAISILLTYIFFGAFLYWIWEDWSFFESFYFVFISMSTIGFGDFVPQHPIYMMLSIIYLVFGLALTSMCINVVQEKLSDTFRQASAKLGTTIGLSVEEPVIIPQVPLNVELDEKNNI